jgi:hypothetical protein
LWEKGERVLHGIGTVCSVGESLNCSFEGRVGRPAGGGHKLDAVVFRGIVTGGDDTTGNKAAGEGRKGSGGNAGAKASAAEAGV